MTRKRSEYYPEKIVLTTLEHTRNKSRQQELDEPWCTVGDNEQQVATTGIYVSSKKTILTHAIFQKKICMLYNSKFLLSVHYSICVMRMRLRSLRHIRRTYSVIVGSRHPFSACLDDGYHRSHWAGAGSEQTRGSTARHEAGNDWSSRRLAMEAKALFAYQVNINHGWDVIPFPGHSTQT